MNDEMFESSIGLLKCYEKTYGSGVRQMPELTEEMREAMKGRMTTIEIKGITDQYGEKNEHRNHHPLSYGYRKINYNYPPPMIILDAQMFDDGDIYARVEFLVGQEYIHIKGLENKRCHTRLRLLETFHKEHKTSNPRHWVKCNTKRLLKWQEKYGPGGLGILLSVRSVGLIFPDEYSDFRRF